MIQNPIVMIDQSAPGLSPPDGDDEDGIIVEVGAAVADVVKVDEGSIERVEVPVEVGVENVVVVVEDTTVVVSTGGTVVVVVSTGGSVVVIMGGIDVVVVGITTGSVVVGTMIIEVTGS
jgi:hypothetical protein